MKLKRELNGQEIDVQDLYAVKIGAIWSQLKSEHFAFWALNAYFFFEYVRPQSIYKQFDILPWSQVTLLLAIVGAFLDPSVKWRSHPLNILMVLFVLVAILSSLFSEFGLPTWESASVLLNWFLVYFLMITVINSEKRFFIFLLAFLLYGYKMSQHGFISWADRGFSFSNWGLQGPPGWFTNSGEFAIAMLIFLPLSIAFVKALYQRWEKIKRWFFYLMPVTAAFTIMGCSSRGAQVALALLTLWVVLRSKARVKVLLVTAVLGFGLYNLLPEEQLARFDSMGEDETSQQRLAYWEAGLDVMNANPVLGVGYSKWFPHMKLYYPSGVGPFRMIQLPHNIFIEVGAELGYLGLLVVLLMIVSVILTNMSTRRIAESIGNPLIGYTAFALDAGLIGYLVAGFFVTVFYYPFFWIQLGFTVTLHLLAKHLKSAASEATKPVDIYKPSW